jgi:dCTP deaminase
MILSAKTIRALCGKNVATPMLNPCHERAVSDGMTYGLSVAGYDVRVEFDDIGAISGRLMKPGDFLLCSTLEEFAMPKNVIAFVHDKSSWARQGLAVQNTVIEPGWCGFLTLELTNHSTKDIHLKRGMPIAQVVFHETDEGTEGYEGKYQDQERGPQSAR